MYWAASLLFFLCGFAGRRGLYVVALAVAALPIGNAYSAYFYKNGLYSYDYYFLSLAIWLFVRSVQQKIFFLKKPLLYLIAMCVIYALLSLLVVNFDLYYLRDFRLIIYALQVYLLITVAGGGFVFDWRSARVFFWVAALSSIFFAIAGSQGWVLYDDVFYQKNSFRYSAASTYVCAAFILLAGRLHDDIKGSVSYRVILLLSFIAVILSGSRTLIFLLVAIYTILRMGRAREIVPALAFLMILALMLFLNFESDLVRRVGEGGVSGLIGSFEMRYSPFFSKLKDMAGVERMLGAGFGSVFEIPWFAYRESKDLYNNFIDSTYLTLYVKFGVLSVFYIFITTKSLASLPGNHLGSTRIAILFFLYASYLVVCMPFQFTAIGLTLGLFLARGVCRVR